MGGCSHGRRARRVLGVVMVCGVVALTMPVFGQVCAPAPFPGAGHDSFASRGVFKVTLSPALGGASYVVSVADPATVILRSAPHADGGGVPDVSGPLGVGASTCPGDPQPGTSDLQIGFFPVGYEVPGVTEVHTEMRCLNMVGGGWAVRAGGRAPARPRSLGEVESRHPAGGFPADSFFLLYLEVQTPAIPPFQGRVLFNRTPILVEEKNICGFPPGGANYLHTLTIAGRVPLFWSDQGLEKFVGWLSQGTHNVGNTHCLKKKAAEFPVLFSVDGPANGAEGLFQPDPIFPFGHPSPNDVFALGPAGPNLYQTEGELFQSSGAMLGAIPDATNVDRLSSALGVGPAPGAPPYRGPFLPSFPGAVPAPAAPGAALGTLGIKKGDNIDALSFGQDGGNVLLFSVGPTAAGLAGSAVNFHAVASPRARAAGGALPSNGGGDPGKEAAGDIYVSSRFGAAKVCAAGATPGAVCVNNANCPGRCQGGAVPAEFCTGAANDCRGACTVNGAIRCSNNAECATQGLGFCTNPAPGTCTAPPIGTCVNIGPFGGGPPLRGLQPAAAGTNALQIDEYDLGLQAPAVRHHKIGVGTAEDDVDALEATSAAAVDANGDGIPGDGPGGAYAPVFFSLHQQANSPSLGIADPHPACAAPAADADGVTSNDVLVSPPPNCAGQAALDFAIYARGVADIELLAGDDLDALVLFDRTVGGELPDGKLTPLRDSILFSLAAGSPSLAANANPRMPPGAHAPGEVFQKIFGVPGIVTYATPAGLGLAAGDELNALDIGWGGCECPPANPLAPTAACDCAVCGFDNDGDQVCGIEDDCPATNDPDQADCDGDGVGDLCDNCVDDFNPDQADFDHDGTGDVCDTTPTPPPANDACGNRTVVRDGTTSFTSIGATTDGPPHGACNVGGDQQVNQDVWFSYQATCDGTLTVSTCGSAFKTKLAVYSGNGCSLSDANLAACNDNVCGDQSQVSVPVTVGSAWTIRVGGNLAATGTGFLSIGCVATPPQCQTQTGTYVDDMPCSIADTNAACHAAPVQTSTIACGQTRTGTVVNDGTRSDFDAYQFAMVGTGQVSFTLNAEFDAVVSIIGDQCPPAVVAMVGKGSCAPVTVSSCLLGGEFYRVLVTPQIGPTTECSALYNLSMSCSGCAIPTTASCPSSGDCTVQHEGPGCSQSVCCNDVSSFDPFCGEVTWDDLCAKEALDVCPGHGVLPVLSFNSKNVIQWTPAPEPSSYDVATKQGIPRAPASATTWLGAGGYFDSMLCRGNSLACVGGPGCQFNISADGSPAAGTLDLWLVRVHFGTWEEGGSTHLGSTGRDTVMVDTTPVCP